MLRNSPMPMRTVRRRRVVLPESPRRPATVWPQWPGVWWEPRVFLALLPLGGVVLGGATERWEQALMLLALGGVLLARPPRASLGWGLNLMLGGLLLLALTAFLPARWFFVPLVAGGNGGGLRRAPAGHAESAAVADGGVAGGVRRRAELVLRDGNGALGGGRTPTGGGVVRGGRGDPGGGWR